MTEMKNTLNEIAECVNKILRPETAVVKIDYIINDALGGIIGNSQIKIEILPSIKNSEV